MLPPLNAFLQQKKISKSTELPTELISWAFDLHFSCSGTVNKLNCNSLKGIMRHQSFQHSTHLAADNEAGAAGRPLHVHNSWWALQAQSGAGEEVRIAKRHSHVVVGRTRNGASCDCNTWRGDGACRRCGESCRHCRCRWREAKFWWRCRCWWCFYVEFLGRFGFLSFGLVLWICGWTAVKCCVCDPKLATA